MSTPTTVALERMYDSATLGITIHPSQPPRICYSLPLLVRKEMARSRVNEETAQTIIWGLIQKLIEEHGDNVPLFIDDAVSREPNKPAIVLDPIL